MRKQRHGNQLGKNIVESRISIEGQCVWSCGRKGESGIGLWVVMRTDTLGNTGI